MQHRTGEDENAAVHHHHQQQQHRRKKVKLSRRQSSREHTTTTFSGKRKTDSNGEGHDPKRARIDSAAAQEQQIYATHQTLTQMRQKIRDEVQAKAVQLLQEKERHYQTFLAEKNAFELHVKACNEECQRLQAERNANAQRSHQFQQAYQQFLQEKVRWENEVAVTTRRLAEERKQLEHETRRLKEKENLRSENLRSTARVAPAVAMPEIVELLTTIHLFFPSNFTTWRPIRKQDLQSSDGSLDTNKVKKAIKKTKVLLHQDKLNSNPSLTVDDKARLRHLWDSLLEAEKKPL